MQRHEATQLCREELNKWGLSDWSIRLNQNAESRFLGLCSHKDKCIILSAHHIDIHPTPDVVNTIKHEVAHAIVGPGNGHNEIWAKKAREVGCDNTQPCSNLSLSPDIIDAIRSGATVEVTFDEEVIRTPKYTVTRLQDKCPVCGKVAKSVSENTVKNPNPDLPDFKFVKLECGHMLTKAIPKGTPFHKFQMDGDENCNHEWEKNKCVKCGRFRPYDFQIEGMRALESFLAVNKGGAVFDEMGLGKTIQALGVIKFHDEYTPTLYIVKSGIKWQWAKQIILWMGPEYVPQVIEKSSDALIPGLKSYIIGYDMLVPKVKISKKTGKESRQGFDIAKFEKRGIKLVVLDECQQIKNADSTRTQMVRRVVKGAEVKVLPLSGTPWKNRGGELFPVFNMMDPTRFHSNEKFIRDWVWRYYEGNRVREGGIKDPNAFREYVKDLCIRRERIEVMKELPLVNRTKLFVQMNEQQEEAYDAAVEDFIKWFQAQKEGITGMAIIAAMAKMRHLVALAKIPATIDFVEEFVEDTDRKLVIFVHHQDVGAILLDELKKRFSEEMPVMKISSSMNGMERFEVQEKFNNSPRALLVASTLAAGEGLNLQTCADCVLHERQWNPANEEQAEGRFIRIGQVAEVVNATYAHCDALTAIDSQLDAIVERKRLAFHSTMNRGEVPKWNENSIMVELAESIINAHHKKKNRKILKFPEKGCVVA